MLSTKNLRLRRPNRKLAPRFVGPFRILDVVGTQAYRLALPETYKIYPVFHVSLLEKYQCRQDAGEEPFLPPPELIDGEPKWIVEEILERKKSKGTFWYKIKWLGYPEEYNQWIPAEDTEHIQGLRDAFDKAASLSKGTKRTRSNVTQ